MADTLVNQPLDENTAQFLEEAATSKFDFHSVSVKAAGDERLKNAVGTAVLRQYTGRQQRLLDLPDEVIQLVDIAEHVHLTGSLPTPPTRS